MNYSIAQRIARVICTVCFALVTATPSLYAAPPSRTFPALSGQPHTTVATEVAEDQLLAHMLTPTAEIRLGPGLANTEKLLQRAGGNSLVYVIRSAWRGIVEYLFPPHGLFHRGDALARIYDPKLLSDLERARELMATADVSPLTIAVAPPGGAETEAEGTPSNTIPPSAPEETPAQVAPPSLRAASPPAREPQEDEPVPAEIDFDFEASYRQQEQLREEAALTAQVLSAAMAEVRAALDALNEAQEELVQRRQLFEAGVLAEQALRPAEERVRQASAAYEAAEAELIEAQEGYERLAERIRSLEQQAAEAHEAIRVARRQRARLARTTDAAVTPAPPQTSAPTTATPSSAPASGQSVELRRADAPEETTSPARRNVRAHPIPPEVEELAAPRWEEIAAQADGMVSEVLAPEGTLVQVGDELLRVADLRLARLVASVPLSELGEFREGRAVTLTFPDYPEAVFEGWVASTSPGESEGTARVELLMVCTTGPFVDDPYLGLRWMTLQAGVGEDKVSEQTIEPVLAPAPAARVQLRLLEIFPTIGPRDAWAEHATAPQVKRPGHYTGRLRLTPMPRLTTTQLADEEGARRLAALNQWRASYIEGMTTAILDDGTVISYPAEGEINTAVRLMLEGRVSHRPNLCAATMREALGWGLGDAHKWAERLPARGYVKREDGLPRPGDILVWPFTYGPGNAQHIGIAVRQGRKLMLLSNLDGRLGTSEILPGYIAFYRPSPKEAS